MTALTIIAAAGIWGLLSVVITVGACMLSSRFSQNQELSMDSPAGD